MLMLGPAVPGDSVRFGSCALSAHRYGANTTLRPHGVAILVRACSHVDVRRAPAARKDE